MTTYLKSMLIVSGTLLCLSAVSAQEATPEATSELSAAPDQIVASHEGLFPEGVEYDPVNNRFLVSSIAEGSVYAVALDGTTTPFIQDERLESSTGLEVDEAGNRLLIASTDLKSTAHLGIYDLTSGENLAFIDFAPLLPNDKEHFANDIAVDNQGNAYVTDSLAGVIYKVDPQGTPTVFLEDETFSTQFALNGIAYNETGNYLIAVRVPGLIKISLDNPSFTPVENLMPIAGEDGIVFTDDSTLAVVSNKLGHVYRVESNDQFTTAQVTGMFDTGLVNPTTVAAYGTDAYVLYAHLNAEETTLSEFPIQKVIFSDN
jgi:sugar lactone lactonase YvrE